MNKITGKHIRKTFYGIVAAGTTLWLGCQGSITAVDSSGPTLAQQEAALQTIFQQTNISASTLQKPYCQWDGVTCDNMGWVTQLDLSNVPGHTVTYQASTLSGEIKMLRYLERLDLGHNQLTALPAEIGNLTHLTGLYLTDNQIATIPMEIGKLTNLQVIDLSLNHLTMLPPEIGNLRELGKLLLDGNRLTGSMQTDFSAFNQLSKLYLLDMDGNPISDVSLPPVLQDRVNRGMLTYYPAH